MNNESEFTDEYVLKLQGQLEEKTYLYNKLQTESKYVINKYKEVLDKIKEKVSYYRSAKYGTYDSDDILADLSYILLEEIEWMI